MNRALIVVILLLTSVLLGCSNTADPAAKPPAVDAPAAANSDHPKDSLVNVSQSSPTDSPADTPETADPHRAKMVVAGGCFWCVEAVFEQLDGVYDAVSGYSGGSKDTANYKAVCTGETGHAEAVEIIYDPTKISYEKLLSVHFATHDPTTKNRQGADEGTQYRSAIFYANDSEKAAAEAMIKRLNDAGVYNRPIVTTLEPLKAFYPAETYHQNFVCDNPYQPYVQGVALPKVAKVRKLFKDDLKKDAKP